MSAGIYIHVPFCAKKCPYCDFYSEQYSAAGVERYADAVCRNLAALPENLETDTVYFGGGTPSLLPSVILGRFLDTLKTRTALSDQAEITIEVNPLTAAPERLAQWRAVGINRISLGVQSFSSDILRRLGRMHTPQQAKESVLRAADAGFANISVDLMVGLAEQSAACFQDDLDTTAKLPVTHISSYILKIEPGTPFGDNPPALLDADDTADRYLQMHDALTQRGFAHYEISNFAKPGFESRHNTKYWRLEPYYGIGPAAHSCYDGKRFAVPPSLSAFCDAPTQRMQVTEPHADSPAERIMLGLRLAEGLDLTALPCHERDCVLRRAKPLIPHYLTNQNSRLSMTPEGWLVSNTVLTELMKDITI